MPLYVQRIAAVYIRDSKAREDITGHLCVFPLQAGRSIAPAFYCGVFFSMTQKMLLLPVALQEYSVVSQISL